MSILTKTIDRPFEVKSTTDDGVFEGHASVFGELDSYRDIVVKGAFDKSLAKLAKAKRDITMLWQHQRHNPIGIYPLKEVDLQGDTFYVRGHHNMDVQQARESHALMRQKALTGLSIGYVTVVDEYDAKNDIRKLKEVDLWEISPVTFPAGDSARVVTVKSINDMTNISDVERTLRDAGFSRKEAEAIIAKVKSINTQGDPADGSQEVKSAIDIIRSITRKE